MFCAAWCANCAPRRQTFLSATCNLRCSQNYPSHPLGMVSFRCGPDALCATSLLLLSLPLSIPSALITFECPIFTFPSPSLFCSPCNNETVYSRYSAQAQGWQSQDQERRGTSYGGGSLPGSVSRRGGKGDPSNGGGSMPLLGSSARSRVSCNTDSRRPRCWLGGELVLRQAARLCPAKSVVVAAVASLCGC